MTLRSYPIANHVLRLGDEAMENTPFADDYMRDTVSWVAGTAPGAAGVPADAIRAKRAITMSWDRVTSYPAQPAMNRVVQQLIFQ